MKLLRKLGTKKNKNCNLVSWAIFLCDNCNQEVERSLSSGLKQKSCGCNEHGETYTRLYRIWNGIKSRCYNYKVPEYKDYGGRGITICPEWIESYINFRDWALSNGYKENLQINRIDNNGNYEPNNCNWIINKENCRNRRNNKLTLEKANEIRILYKTGNYTQKELAEKFNVSKMIISNIIHNKIWV